MTKKEIRTLIWKSLTEIPKKWTQVVDRTIWLGISGWVGVTAFTTNNAGTLLFLIFMALLGLGLMYLNAKGK